MARAEDLLKGEILYNLEGTTESMVQRNTHAKAGQEDRPTVPKGAMHLDAPGAGSPPRTQLLTTFTAKPVCFYLWLPNFNPNRKPTHPFSEDLLSLYTRFAYLYT